MHATLGWTGSGRQVVSAALEHPIGPTTVEEWLAQEHPEDGSRLELIYGYLHVSPPPTGQHQYAGFELCTLLKNALRDARHQGLYPVPGVAVKISTARRTGLIPDAVVLRIKPIGVAFEPGDVVLAVEVWSPDNTRAERETKMAEYAGAGVPFFWAVNQDKTGRSTVTAYYLDRGRYVEELTARPGTTVTIRLRRRYPLRSIRLTWIRNGDQEAGEVGAGEVESVVELLGHDHGAGVLPPAGFPGVAG
jgi:Uma2 family endonuclease